MKHSCLELVTQGGTQCVTGKDHLTTIFQILTNIKGG